MLGRVVVQVGTAARPSEAPLWCGGVAGGVSDSLSPPTRPWTVCTTRVYRGWWSARAECAPRRGAAWTGGGCVLEARVRLCVRREGASGGSGGTQLGGGQRAMARVGAAVPFASGSPSAAH